VIATKGRKEEKESNHMSHEGTTYILAGDPPLTVRKQHPHKASKQKTDRKNIRKLKGKNRLRVFQRS